MITPKEYEAELKRWGIQYEVIDYKIHLYGGDKKARQHYEYVLKDDSELEALLILIYTNKDAELRDVIEEIAARRQADGLPGDLLSAVKVQMRGSKE